MGATAAKDSENKNPPQKSEGVNFSKAAFQPTNCPTEFRSHKGEDPFMGSGCKILIAAKMPSSARQLPILAALYARASTLFGHIIHHGEKKVNRFFEKY